MVHQANKRNATLLAECFGKNSEIGADIRIAARLLRQFGQLRDVILAGEEELLRVEGMNPGRVAELGRIRLLIHAFLETELRDRDLLADCEDVLRYCRKRLAGRRREMLLGLYLDRGYHLLESMVLQAGTVDHVTLYPREILAGALRANACATILVHNHPGGDAGPSEADRAMTYELVRAARPLGIEIADHVIIGRGGCFSFRRNGLLDALPERRVPAICLSP